MTETVNHLAHYGGADNPSPTDVAWAAGFFDGEGTIAVTRGYFKHDRWGPYHHMKISASQRRREPLDKLVALFEGTVCRSKSRDIYIWTCTTRKGLAALRAMLPYLVVKKDEAIVAINFQERRKTGGHAKADGAQDERDMVELARLKRISSPNFAPIAPSPGLESEAR